VYVRGFDQVAQLEYNPLINGVRRPLDVDGVPGTSASRMQLTSWADSWYRGLLVSLEKAPRSAFPVPGCVHPLES
jgi:hypothetical protein